MQQHFAGVETPLRSIIRQVEQPSPSGAKVWRQMTIVNRERIARAAFVPESTAHVPWESLPAAHRSAIKHACNQIAKAVKGFSDDA